jgi:hypothetical protein
MQSGECGALELIGVGWVVVIGAGRLLGIGAYVLVKASTARQLHLVIFVEEFRIPC